MTILCGVELKSSEAVLSIADQNGSFVDLPMRRIRLSDHESCESLKAFQQDIQAFVKDNGIDKLIIKKRAKKGPMAGGAVSFKMEATIQLSGIPIEFVTGQRIAIEEKKAAFRIPITMKKFQYTSYKAVSLYIRMNS